MKRGTVPPVNQHGVQEFMISLTWYSSRAGDVLQKMPPEKGDCLAHIKSNVTLNLQLKHTQQESKEHLLSPLNEHIMS